MSDAMCAVAAKARKKVLGPLQLELEAAVRHLLCKNSTLNHPFNLCLYFNHNLFVTRQNMEFYTCGIMSALKLLDTGALETVLQ